MPYYGPGMPWYGRGAGNIQAAEREKARIAADVEANSSPTSSSTESPSSLQTPSSQQTSPYTGRGGAGNYFVPVAKMDHIDVSADASFTSIREGIAGSSKTIGRGGVGNYAAHAAEGEQKEKNAEMRQKDQRQRLQLDIEKGVEEALAMPQRAKLPLSSPKDVRVPAST